MEPNKKGHLHHSAQPLIAPAKPRLLDQMRDRIRSKHYSLRTEHAFLGWVKRFILFNDKRHPAELSAVEVERFLSLFVVVGFVLVFLLFLVLVVFLFLFFVVFVLFLLW